MKKNVSRIGALALAAVMAIPMAVPGFAASNNTHWVTATLDGSQVFRESYPAGGQISEIDLVDDLGVGVDISVSVNGNVVSTTRPVNATGTLTNGTVYRLAEDSDRSLKLSTTNNKLADDLDIAITRTARSYQVTANSGPQGFKDNMGSDQTPTCDISGTGTGTVNGNTAWSSTFTPKSGQVIKAFNIRTAAGSQNIITAENKTVQVGSTQVTISKSGDAYTVKTNNIADNLYVTALTADRSSQYQLSVVTVGDVTTDVVSKLLTAGETQKVVLTPGTGVIDTIVIEDGGKSGTLTTGGTSVSVNGHTYAVSWASNGKATVSVPGISANVTITATSRSDKAGLTINASSDVECNLANQTYPKIGDPVTVRLAGKEFTEITSVTISSATDRVTLTGKEYRFTLDGRAYRVDSLPNGSKVLYFDSFPGNITIDVDSKETRHVITLQHDGDSDFEGSRDEIIVYDGDSETITFKALDSSEDIERLVFTVNGKKITADYDDDYVVIDGTRQYLNWMNGKVEVELRDIQSSMTIKSFTTDYDEDYRITVDHDGGATTTNDYVYVNHGQSRTITFKERSGYTIEAIRVTVDGETYEAERGDSYLTVDGRRCSLSWGSSQSSITLNNIRDDMEVYCETDYDGSRSDYRIDVDHDGGATTNNSYVYADRGDNKTITFTEKSGYTIEAIRVTVDGKTYEAERGDSYLTVDGRRCSLSWGSSKSSITLNNIRDDMKVYCDTDYAGTSNPTWGDYTVTLENDRGSYYLGYGEIGVDSGDDQEVSFYAEDGNRLQRLEIVYKGTTYKANYGASSVTINGQRCSVDWDGRDSVSIDLRNIKGNMTVRAVSDRTTDSKTITRDAGTGANIDLSTSSASVDVGRAVTVTVRPDSGYTIDTVTFSFDSRSERAVLNRFDTAFTLGGVTYTTTRGNDGSLSVRFDSVPANMTVKATAVQGTVVTPPVVSGTTHEAYIAGIGNGLFAPNRTVTRGEALVMLLRATQSLNADSMTGMVQHPFIDVGPTSWLYNYVTVAYNRGYLFYLNGTTPTNFNPNAPISRAQFVELACRVFGISNNGPVNTQYNDVLPGYWGASYITQATAAGWINGYGDGRFGPDDTLTRAQLVTIINRATGRRADPGFLNANIGRLNTFSDVGPSYWAYYDILEAANTHTFSSQGGREVWG